MISAVGSEAWQGAEQLVEGGHLETLAKTSMKNTKWENLTKMCSSHRQNISCKTGQSFCIGTQNLVRLVEFEDGVKWVARICMLEDGEEKDTRVAASAEKIMENQVATYRYIRLHSTIPVPEVYAFNPRTNVEIGAPYMLLEYIHGTAADSIEELELGTNEEATRYVLKQLASMMVELGACKFDHIGSIFENADGDFEIGPLIETDGGPYKTAQEYYQALGERRFHDYARGHFASNEDARLDGGLHLPLLFSSFMPAFCNSVDDKGPFGLANTDFGFHNVLVDGELNIVGLIDCDAIIAAPIHTVAQLPLAAGMSGEVPGYKNTDPSRVEYRTLGTRWLSEFVPMVAAAETKVGSETPIADVILSDAATLIQGLNDYHGFQSWRNVEWVNGYWYLYYRLVRGPSAAVEFNDADMGVEMEEEEGEEAEETEEKKRGEQEENGEEEERARSCVGQAPEDLSKKMGAGNCVGVVLEDLSEEEGVGHCVGAAPENFAGEEGAGCRFHEGPEDLSEDGEVCGGVTTKGGPGRRFRNEGRTSNQIENLQDDLSEDGEVCRESTNGEFARELSNKVETSTQIGTLQEAVATKNETEKEGPSLEISEQLVAEVKEMLKRELIAEIMGQLAAEVNSNLMKDLKKVAKELKQELVTKLTMYFQTVLKFAHSKEDIGLEAVDAEETDGDKDEEHHAVEQRPNKGELSLRVPKEGRRVEDASKGGPVHELRVGQEVNEDGVVDDQEQGASAGNATICSIMGP